jgi:hypothetical protein
MRERTFMISFVWIGLILSLCGQSSAQQLHAILIGDVSPSTGFGKYTSAVKNDLIGLTIAIEENMPKSRINLRMLEFHDDENSSPEAILGLINKVEVKADDTILFYYTGHGSVDDRGHYLALAQGKLYRQELLNLLSQKGARLITVITDCCNTRSDGYTYIAPYFEIPDRKEPSPLFRKLFFESRGVVDINSSSPGESSFFAPYQKNESGPDGSPGSIFTLSWLDWMQEEKQNRRTWDDMVRAVSLKVHKKFKDYFPKGASIAKGSPIQSDQNVYPFTYPDFPKRQGPRTGLVVRDFPGKGSVIIEVAPGSPGTQVYLLAKDSMASLKPQQVIIAINGKTTPNTKTVVQEVNRSPQIMRLTIRDVKLGTFDVLLRMKY